jgi:hypothetical protein
VQQSKQNRNKAPLGLLSMNWSGKVAAAKESET